MRDFSSKKGDASVSEVFARPGSRYLVIDIGGNVSDHCGHDVKFVRNEYFCLGSTTMKKLLDPVIKGIVEHLKNLLKSRALKRVGFFFLVRRFAESVVLQDAIQKQFNSQFTILVPNNAGIAVVQEAVVFRVKDLASLLPGKCPQLMVSRFTVCLMLVFIPSTKRKNRKESPTARTASAFL